MQATTFGQIDNKVRRDLDLQDADNFIPFDEMAGYGNEGIDAAEAIIHKIDEDYFLTKAVLNLVQGQEDVALPSDIYAQKIREVVYKKNDTVYPLRRLRDPHAFYKKAVADLYVNNTEEYEYFLRMDSGSSQAVMMLAPPAYETGAYLQFWYIRNAARIPLIEEGSSRAAQIATILDIPEFRSFVEQFMKVRCLEKMKDFPAMADARDKLVAIGEQMTNTLTNRVPDRDDEVPQDVTHYQEHN